MFEIIAKLLLFSVKEFYLKLNNTKYISNVRLYFWKYRFLDKFFQKSAKQMSLFFLYLFTQSSFLSFIKLYSFAF